MADDDRRPSGPDDALAAARREMGGLDSWPLYVPPPAPAAAASHPSGDGRPVRQLAGQEEDGAAWGPIDHRLAKEPPNDMGNANRLLLRHGDDLIYVRDVGWHAWVDSQESQRWNREEGGRHAHIQAHRTAAAINREADALEAALVGQLAQDEKDGLLGTRPAEIDSNRAVRQKANDKRVAGLRGHALQSGNVAKAAAMLTAASPYLTRSIDDLDAQPDLLAVANGVIEFGAAVQGGVRLRPALREDLITRQCRFVYDRDAECPTWLAFLEQAQPDREIREFLQRHVGYSLTGHTHEQFVVLHWGKGSNGKSTYIETLEWGFGDYGLRLPFASLLRDDRKRGAEATPDLARLPGRRWVVASETEDNVTLSSATIKDLTERDSMTVRYLNQGFFDFTPQHKLSIMFNPKPNIPAVDDGTWRRLRLTPWDMKFIDEHERAKYPDAPLKDPTLGERLRKELPGILNWALDGWRMWREKGLAPPQSVSEATAAYRAENDPVGGFLDAVTMPAMEHEFVPGKQLYDCYRIWADLSGAPRLSNTKFGKIAKGKLRSETSGIVKYIAIRIDPKWWNEYGHLEPS